MTYKFCLLILNFLITNFVSGNLNKICIYWTLHFVIQGIFPLLLWQQDTPVPGTYDLKDFVEELQTNPVRPTYGFKNAGRKRDADPSRKGSHLMPGLYKHATCVDQLDKQKVTYSFKACDRYHTPTALVGYIDKVTCSSE